MAMPLRAALQDTLRGWREDIDPPWRAVVRTVSLAFDDVGPTLESKPWEPIFPARRGMVFPGAPAGAHMLRAFDGIAPGDVRCVILGQDPYPCPAFATGRAFEAGNVARWRELDKMFSHERPRIHPDDPRRADRRRRGTPKASRSGPRLSRPSNRARSIWRRPSALADRWVASGVLLLNSSLTLTRFLREGDPHQMQGHLPLWRPLMIRVLTHLAERGTPVVYPGIRRCGGGDAPRGGTARA